MDEITDNILKFVAAFQFAVDKHNQAKQTREDLVTPYWVHPLRVAERIKAVGINDYEIVSAAVLHDVIEDTDTDLAYLEARFGKRVSQMVADVSLGADQSLADYNTQIQNSSSDSQTVKLADKWDNVNELRRMKYATYGNQLPLEYIRDAEDTLAACPNGNPRLRELLKLEIKKAKKEFGSS